MARQVDPLVRAGVEGFGDLNELYVRGGNYRRPGGRVPYSPITSCVHPAGYQVLVINPVVPGDIDSNEAARLFGGIKIVSDFPKGTKQAAANNYRSMDRIDRF